MAAHAARVGQVDRDEARAEQLTGLATGDRDHVAIGLAGEMLHRGMADEAGGAGDQDRLAGHGGLLERKRAAPDMSGTAP